MQSFVAFYNTRSQIFLPLHLLHPFVYYACMYGNFTDVRREFLSFQWRKKCWLSLRKPQSKSVGLKIVFVGMTLYLLEDSITSKKYAKYILQSSMTNVIES